MINRHKKWLQYSLRLLLGSVLIIVLLEILLRLLDPWGAYRYLNESAYLRSLLTPVPEGYTLSAGTYTFSYWSLSIDTQGRRVVPASQAADCRLAAVGDSVTFAWGVNDADTWLNYLAAALPDVQFINAAKPAYNITNVRRSLESLQADGYLYLIFANDPEATRPFRNSNISLTALESYQLFLRGSYIMQHDPVEQYYDYDNFWQELENLKRANVLRFAFASDNLSQTIAERYPDVILLNMNYSDYAITRADAHLNVEGNRLLADLMLPYVTAFAERIC